MKKFLLIVAMLVLMAGCSTAQCQKAQKGIAIAEIGLAAATTPEQQEYYRKYLEAAQRIYAIHCIHAIDK